MASTAITGINAEKPVPFRLRRLCGRTKTPSQVLAEAITAHATLVEAADALGVDVATLRRWRRTWPVEMAR